MKNFKEKYLAGEIPLKQLMITAMSGEWEMMKER